MAVSLMAWSAAGGVFAGMNPTSPFVLGL